MPFSKDHPRTALSAADRALLKKTLGSSTKGALGCVWRGIREKVYLHERYLTKLPIWCEGIAKTFYERDEEEVLVAIKRGDVSFFLCFMLRLDQIDCECIKAGMDAGARAHIIQCRAALDGFRQAAQKRLESLGGEFPPQPRQSEPKKTQTAVRPAA